MWYKYSCEIVRLLTHAEYTYVRAWELVEKILGHAFKDSGERLVSHALVAGELGNVFWVQRFGRSDCRLNSKERFRSKLGIRLISLEKPSKEDWAKLQEYIDIAIIFAVWFFSQFGLTLISLKRLNMHHMAKHGSRLGDC